jgi:DNA polymerase gamma 1
VRWISVAEQPRINPVGIQYLSKTLDAKIFPSKLQSAQLEVSNHDQQLIELSKRYLDTHELLGKRTSIQKPISIDIPDLTASNLDDHFKRIALFASNPYKDYALRLANSKLPSKPAKFLLKSGWLKYNKGRKTPIEVPFPDEDAIVFDVETLYKISNYPVMAVACSPNAWYAWCSPILTGESDSFEHLVPLNTLQRKQVVVGHNVGYDRARVKEEYDLQETKAFYLDTMSLHIAASGMCSQQRAKWMERKKALKEENVVDESGEITNDVEKAIRQLEIDDPWLNYSSPNSLADLSYFYFGEKVDKEIRNSFAGDDIELIKEDFQNLINYCANDVFVTHKIYSEVLPEFLKTCPHPVSFAALRFMSAGILPTDEKWGEYLNNAESLYLRNRKRVDDRLLELAEAALLLKDKPDVFENDPWLSQLDWTITPIRITKAGTPYKNQKLPGFPQWYKDLYTSKDGKLTITTRTRVTPLLLKLKFEGYPVNWDDKFGWCFKANKIDYQRLTNLNYQLIPELTFDEDFKHNKIDESILPDILHYKIPNPASAETKTAQLLSKSNMPAFDSGILKSDESFAQEALELNATCSYWISARDRIKSQFVVPNGSSDGKPSSLIIPQVITMGTITRRAVEKTWLTASNAKSNRIGSELKSKVRAPETHCFVGADVDSEELWIASLMGDSILAQHGGTAIGWMTLEGSKKEGTDLHSKTANILGINRDQAKIFNYGRIYGAGVKFAASLLKKFNAELSEKECQERAKVLYMETKGQTVNVSIDGERRKIWFGGSESVLFNELERIANLEKPRTPVLKAGITKALMKKNLNLNSFLPSRVNWAIQSSGVDYLHLLCVSMNFLINKYELSARLSLSVHDEIRYLCDKKDKYRVAMALQISNLWTRGMFAESVGMMDLPQSCAFFSAVDVDHILRKEVDMDCVTPSNPIAEKPGESLDVLALLEKGHEALLGKGKELEIPELIESEVIDDDQSPETNYKYSYENPDWKTTSVMMQISQNKHDVQRYLREYKKNYGRLDFKDVLSGELTGGSGKKASNITNDGKRRSGPGKKSDTAETTKSASKILAKTKATHVKKKTPAKKSAKKEPERKQSSKSTRGDELEHQNVVDQIHNMSIDEIANIRDTSFYNMRSEEDDIWAGIIKNEEDFINSLNPNKR